MHVNAPLPKDPAKVPSAKPQLPPGPRLNPLSFLLFGPPQDILGFYTEVARDFGDLVRFPMGPWSWYAVFHPTPIQHVLQDHCHNYTKKNRFNDLIKPLTGEGLATSDGDLWRRHRRLLQPAFHRQRLAELATVTTNTTALMLEQWRHEAKNAEPFDVRLAMQRLTLNIVGRTLFSQDISAESDAIGRSLTTVFEYFNYRTRHVFALPERIPTRRNRRLRQAIRTFDTVVYRMIEERRSRGNDADDLLSMLLLARDEVSGDGLSDKALRDEVGTFIGAGHETTATALAWTWYVLSKHPDVGHRLRAELADVLGGRLPTLEDLPHLTYTKMVLQEVMRIYPPIWAMLRSTIEDDTIGGYAIPANSLVVLCPYVTHRHPLFWDNPEEFDPERFTPERSAKRPRYAYLPFGGGPRQCIGHEFAMMEMQLIIAMVAQQYQLDLVPGYPVEPDPIFTLRPKKQVLMTVRSVSAPSGRTTKTAPPYMK